MHHDQRARAHQLHAEIAVRYAVEAVFTHGGEAQLLCLEHTVRRICRPGQRTAADGGGVRALIRVRKPSIVALQHHRIRQQLLAECDRLCPLQMRVTGHNGVLVRLRLRMQRLHDGQNQRLQRLDLIL